MAEQHALEFRHSFDDQIGSQLSFAGFYEACWNSEDTPLNRYMSTSTATLAFKPDVAWTLNL